MKGLSGPHSKINDFTSQFRMSIHELVRSGQDTRSGAVHLKSASKQLRRAEKQEPEEDITGMYQITSSIYQLNKAMSQEQYTVGRSVQEYFRDFHLQYKSIAESAALLPQPMQSVVGFVNSTIRSLESGHNLGKDSTSKEMLNQCRPTVERYIFGKLNEKLFAMYSFSNQKQDELFAARQP